MLTGKQVAKAESIQPFLLPEHGVGHIQPFTRRWETQLSEEPPGNISHVFLVSSSGTFC